MSSNAISNERFKFVRDFLCNVCDFDSDISDLLIAYFRKVDNNSFCSIHLNNNEKYLLRVDFFDDAININSKVITTYEYDDGVECFKEEYIDQRKDKFMIEENRLHHVYDRKSTVSYSQQFGALREGMKEYRGDCYYLLDDNFSFDNVKASLLQKVKK